VAGRLGPIEEKQSEANDQPASLKGRLARIERLESELMKKAGELFSLNTSLYHADFFVLGAIKRTVAQSSGFRMLIEARNFQCAAALVRMQIDTAMRLNGLRLVKDRDALCVALLEGKPFNKLKDAEGKPMSDLHLRKQLEPPPLLRRHCAQAVNQVSEGRGDPSVEADHSPASTKGKRPVRPRLRHLARRLRRNGSGGSADPDRQRR
jgi:hypothetical protein